MSVMELQSMRISAAAGTVAAEAERLLDQDPRADVSEFLDVERSDIVGVKKVVRPHFEDLGKQIMNSEPEIIFVSEYIVNDEFAGALLVWEKSVTISHYEVFKRNLFSQRPKFERILFLSSRFISEETKELFPYVRDVLGFSELREEDIMIFLDHKVKKDRIYEYKIQATRVPAQPQDVDYDLALESRNLTTSIGLPVSSSSNLFEFSGATLGSEDLAWVLSLMNEEIRFFGRSPSESPLSALLSETREFNNEYKLEMPKDIGHLTKAISESISLFGVRESFAHIADVLGGLSKEFKCAFVDAIDETRDVFSYDRFKIVIASQLPVFNLLLSLSESPSLKDKLSLSQLSIIMPTNKGSEELTSIDGLSKVFKFVNDSLIATLYSQDKLTFKKLQKIVLEIEAERAAEEDPIEIATQEVAQETVSTTSVAVVQESTTTQYQTSTNPQTSNFEVGVDPWPGSAL